jgi:hypothetical protein
MGTLDGDSGTQLGLYASMEISEYLLGREGLSDDKVVAAFIPCVPCSVDPVQCAIADIDAHKAPVADKEEVKYRP